MSLHELRSNILSRKIKENTKQGTYSKVKAGYIEVATELLSEVNKLLTKSKQTPAKTQRARKTNIAQPQNHALELKFVATMLDEVNASSELDAFKLSLLQDRLVKIANSIG